MVSTIHGRTIEQIAADWRSAEDLAEKRYFELQEKDKEIRRLREEIEFLRLAVRGARRSRPGE